MDDSPFSERTLGRHYPGRDRCAPDAGLAARVANALEGVSAALLDPELEATLMRARVGGFSVSQRRGAPNGAEVSQIREDERAFVLEVRSRAAGIELLAEVAFRKKTRGNKTRALNEAVAAEEAEALRAFGELPLIEAREVQISPAMIAAYSAATGDGNPLYLDDEAAQMTGLPSAIVPQAVLAELLAVSGGETQKYSFSKPALVGVTLRIEARGDPLSPRVCGMDPDGELVAWGVAEVS